MGWRRVDLRQGVSFAVPPDALGAEGSTVDSTAGWFEGDGYRITFDLGRFGERMDRLAEEQGAVPLELVIAGRRATEVSFEPTDEPFEHARVVQVALGQGRTLTIRVSWNDAAWSNLANAVRGSIAFT